MKNPVIAKKMEADQVVFLDDEDQEEGETLKEEEQEEGGFDDLAAEIVTDVTVKVV